jgi:hypothetical protein
MVEGWLGEESTTTNEHPATDDKTRSNMSTEELE